MGGKHFMDGKQPHLITVYGLETTTRKTLFMGWKHSLPNTLKEWETTTSNALFMGWKQPHVKHCLWAGNTHSRTL